ncbi:MAG TPA: hypothetical protein VFP99_02180, partial [Chthoniobacterales bacterium]|nr:hypothetical protein [Chthoniobacterales bacterium]
DAFAGPAPVSGGPNGVTTEPVISSPTSSNSNQSTSGIAPPSTGAYANETGSSGAPSAATPGEGKTDESDDTLYRGKTSESENPMMRDEGRLHFKTRPKEKIQEVDSLKKLPSSGTDPKFQGSLLHSAVTDIENVSGKSNETDDAADEEDPRFKKKRLVFKAEKRDESKQAQADSTPSATPSPTASPAAQNSSKQ